MNNLLSYFGLVDPRISASDKDLPISDPSSAESPEPEPEPPSVSSSNSGSLTQFPPLFIR